MTKTLEESCDSLEFSQTKLKPILFNTDMVRAILDGRKTVTRRVVKDLSEAAHYPMGVDDEDGKFEFMCGGGSNGTIADWIEAVSMPYKFGDVLYVRETWGYDKNNWLYKADYTEEYANEPGNLFRWHPSIHMPKEAARIFLRVTDVRVERLQDITIADCKREGVVLPPLRGDEYDCEFDSDLGYLIGFQRLWDSTIKRADIDKYGWNENPWVWVIVFERINREEV